MQYSKNKYQQLIDSVGERPHSIHVHHGTSAFAVLGNLALSGAILYFTRDDGAMSPVGLVGAVVSFGTLTPITIMAQNGGLVEVIRGWQETWALREQLRWQARQEARWQVVDTPQLPSPSVEGMQGVRYVPAVPRVSEAAKVDAANFIMQLFDSETGRPLPNKITPKKGQIQHKSPSPEAVEYLTALGIVTQPYGTQLYMSPHFPTLRDAINAIRTGRKPSYEQGKEEGAAVEWVVGGGGAA